MSIQSIKLDKKTFDNLDIGLSELPLDTAPIDMHSLGPVVVIAGANGAGKSRLLRLINLISKKVLSEETVASYKLNRTQFEANISSQISYKSSILSNNQGSLNDDIKQNSIAQTERNIASFTTQIRSIDLALAGHAVLGVTPATPFSVIDFVPKNPRLQDASVMTDHDARKRADALTYGGSANAEINAPAYARRVLRAAVMARDRVNTHGDSDGTAEQAEKKLRQIMCSLLGDSFLFELNDDLNIRVGRDSTESYSDELSQGQQVLFQLACMLHAQGDRLCGSVILMDEPENHLHPAVLNEVMDQLRKAPNIGQIWVATHSVPLIAHMLAIDPECLWYAEAGSFKRAGRTPMQVLESLMGGAEGPAELQALTRLPAEYAAARFLSECLVEPGVVGPDTKDPQTNQITEILSTLAKSRGRALRIVDFGAGIGRLLTTLATCAPGDTPEDFVDYLAIEPDKEKHAKLSQEIDAVYKNGSDSRIFLDESDLSTRIDAGSVDCIVMCNVLHEISPDEWTSLFNPQGPMMRTLAEDGYILFVEDYGIPVGERAHNYGFLLLDEGELKSLFDITEADRLERRFVRMPSTQIRYCERLVAHLVSKECAKRVSPQSRREAIRILRDRSGKDVRTYLNTPPVEMTGGVGRDYARNAQLYANASIWLKVHEGE